MMRTGKNFNGHGVFIFAVLAIGGIILLVWLGPDLWKHTRTRSWTAIPATILSSELYSNQSEHSVVARYRYEFGGQTHIGTRFALASNRVDGPAHGRQVLNQFQAGKVVTCYVDPSDPTTSILQPSSIVETLMLIAVTVVTGWGIGGFLLALRADLKTDHAAIAWTDRASFWILPLVFIIAGAIGIAAVAIIPLFRAISSGDWREEPCTIVASTVLHGRTAKGGSRYRFDIAYEYAVNGQVHVGTLYNFGPSSGRFASMSQLAATSPVGSKTVCYVNPKDPTDAVLVRKSDIGWVVLVPGIFLAAGTMILITDNPGISKKRKSSRIKKIKDQAA